MATTTQEDGPGAGALSAAHAMASPLALHSMRSPGELVGRPAEMTALEQELAAASGRLVGVTLEGEPGSVVLGADIADRVQHLEGVVAVRDRFVYPARSAPSFPSDPGL